MNKVNQIIKLEKKTLNLYFKNNQCIEIADELNFSSYFR